MALVVTRRRGSSSAAAAQHPGRAATPPRRKTSRQAKRAGSPKSSSDGGSNPSIPISAVCFDLDGVLILTMPLHAQAWQEALQRYGLRASRREIYRWEGEPGRVTAQRLLRRAGRPATSEAITALLGGKERRFAQLARRIAIVPAFQRLLQRLAARGTALALVTGTSWREVQRVVPRAVRARFRVLITGDRVRHGKPHPEPYRRAMRELRVPPARTAVLENAPYGIRSAQHAGAGLVIALASSLPPRYLREADGIVRSPTEAARLLDQLTQPD